MKLTVAKELEIREYFKTEVLLALPGFASHVLTTPMYFASAQDFAKMVGDSYSKTYKVKYIVFNYGRFEDSRKQGCDDDPVTFLTYKWQLFRETQEARDNAVNSHDQLVSDMINLRNRFLINKDIVTNKIVHQGLVQAGDLITVQESEYVVGLIGDWFNFRLTVEINS